MLEMLYDFRTIALVSGLVCIIIAFNAYAQAWFFTDHGRLLRTFGLGMFAGGVALVGSSWTEGSFSVERLALVWIPAVICHWLGFLCVRGLFGSYPKNTRALPMLAATIWALPFLTGSAWGELWMYCAEALFSVASLIVVVRGREPAAPGARIVIIVMNVLYVLAPLSLALAVAPKIAEYGAQSWAVMPERAAGPVLAWAFMPIVYSFVFFSIINARVSVRLRELADYDSLTGMKVRRIFYEESQRLIDRRNNAHQEVAVMMIDIDNFKSINDKYGHPVGDLALQHCAQIIRSTIRADTLVARYGGEEFCVLSRVNDRREGHAIAERIRARVEALPLLLKEDTISMSVSVGVAFHEPYTTIETLLDKADRHLYLAKRNGRNRVVALEPVAQPAL